MHVSFLACTYKIGSWNYNLLCLLWVCCYITSCHVIQLCHVLLSWVPNIIKPMDLIKLRRSSQFLLSCNLCFICSLCLISRISRELKLAKTHCFGPAVLGTHVAWIGFTTWQQSRISLNAALTRILCLLWHRTILRSVTGLSWQSCIIIYVCLVAWSVRH